MNVREAKKHIIEFINYKPESLLPVLNYLDTDSFGNMELEPEKCIYRLFSRFIDLAKNKPPQALLPDYRYLHNQVETFLSDLKISDGIHIRDVRTMGTDGQCLSALFDIFAIVINYREMEENISYQMVVPLEKMDVLNLKFTLKNFVEPIQDRYKVYKILWNLNLDKRPLEVSHTHACHLYLYQLFSYALFSYLRLDQLAKDATLSTIRSETLRLIELLPWDHQTAIKDIIVEDEKSAALAAMQEIIVLFYALPKPLIPQVLSDIVP